MSIIHLFISWSQIIVCLLFRKFSPFKLEVFVFFFFWLFFPQLCSEKRYSSLPALLTAVLFLLTDCSTLLIRSNWVIRSGADPVRCLLPLHPSGFRLLPAFDPEGQKRKRTCSSGQNAGMTQQKQTEPNNTWSDATSWGMWDFRLWSNGIQPLSCKMFKFRIQFTKLCSLMVYDDKLNVVFFLIA